MFLVLSLVATLAGAEDRPRYGIESTVTNETLTALCTEETERLFESFAKFVENSDDRLRALEVYDRAFPRQMEVYDQFVKAFFADVVQPKRTVHKNRFPAYRRYFPDGYWMQPQFEPQAIELQAQPLILPEYLTQCPRIDRHFFAVGRRRKLKPIRTWGMGQLSEDLGPSAYPKTHVERLRNRIVREYDDVYFWPLVGANVEAEIQWDAHPEGMRDFGTWLARFDRWLDVTAGPPEGRDTWSAEIADSLLLDPIFRKVPMKTKRDLYSAMSVSEATDKLGEYPQILAFVRGMALSEIFTIAVKCATDASSGVAFAIKTPTKDDEIDSVLEFRRIPSHRNADEAAMWMNLLEGRWRLARDERGLVPLARPRPPANDRERIALFERYILSAGANPLDFATFLPLRLRWRVLLKKYPTPRWAERRRAILCEHALSGRSPSPG